MKKSTMYVSLLTAALLALGTAALAEEVAPKVAEVTTVPAAPAVTGDVYLGPGSKYIFRGNSISPNNAFVVQGGIDLTYKQFTVSYWMNFQNRNNGYNRAKITENDLTLDYAIPHSIPNLEKLKLNVGTQYFSVDGAEDTNEFYLKASYDTLLKPSLAVYWDTITATRAGLFYTASVSHSFELLADKVSLNLGALASYNQRNPSAAYTIEGDGVYSGWHNYELSAAIDYKPTSSVTITPSYLFSNALSVKARDLVGLKDQNVIALKVMFTF